jgi:hypothetical protein
MLSFPLLVTQHTCGADDAHVRLQAQVSARELKGLGSGASSKASQGSLVVRSSLAIAASTHGFATVAAVAAAAAAVPRRRPRQNGRRRSGWIGQRLSHRRMMT